MYYLCENYYKPIMCEYTCLVMSNLATLWMVARQLSVHGILQARILEWVAISSSRRSY